MITRIRPVEDTAQWVAGDTGQIVEAVKLSDLESVHIDDLADCAHQLNGALEARGIATARATEAERRASEAERRSDVGDREVLDDALAMTMPSINVELMNDYGQGGVRISTMVRALADAYLAAVVNNDALRAKLAEAERNVTRAEAARNSWLDKSNEQHDRFARLEQAIRAMPLSSRSLHVAQALRDIDSLTPSPASEGEQPKGDVHLNDVAGLYDCGACGFSKLSIGAAPCSECVLGGGPDVAPLYFVRRLPLAPAKPADKHCGDCVYRNTTAAPGLCANVFSALYQEARGTDDAKACDLHSTKWLCGRCLGGGFAKHTHNCSLRDKPEPQPARTCGECSVFDRLDRERICQRAACNLSRLDPACPAFVRSPAAEQEVKS